MTPLFEVIADIDPTDYSKLSAALDTADAKLDYRRYGDSFFELFVTGGLIAPGGIVQDDEEHGKVPFSLFVLADGPDKLAGAKHWGELITRLTQRYKYLERQFAEASEHVLKGINRYGDEDNKKLAMGLGVLVSNGFMSLEPLKVLQVEHLTKDGLALRFITDVLRIYLGDNSVEQLRKALARGKIADLADFFPPNKRDDDCVARHFEVEEMPELTALHAASVTAGQRVAFVREAEAILREANDDDSDDDEANAQATNLKVARAARAAMRANKWEEADMVVLAWDGIMRAVNWPTKVEQIESRALRQIQRHSDVLEVLTTEPKSEIALLKHVQLYAHNEPRLTRFFGRMVLELYNTDVLSDSAIIFWSTKGAKPEGKSGFLKQTEALVRKLQAMEGDDSDSDDE
ncbi:hypothetical protein H4R19_000390 [Coemansia spiralis]|nr:hypothetical protein H4R19_000390 [Coemansia spiralis]